MYLRRQRGFTLVELIVVLAIFALLMRIIIDPAELIDDLHELEAIETEQINSDRLLPPSLEPLTTAVPESYSSKLIYVPFYRTLYVGENRTDTCETN